MGEPQYSVIVRCIDAMRGDRHDIDPMRRGGAKSFVDDLVFGRGVVLSRAATSLRSIETQPWTRRFVCLRQAHLLLLFLVQIGLEPARGCARPAGAVALCWFGSTFF